MRWNLWFRKMIPLKCEWKSFTRSYKCSMRNCACMLTRKGEKMIKKEIRRKVKKDRAYIKNLPHHRQRIANVITTHIKYLMLVTFKISRTLAFTDSFCSFELSFITFVAHEMRPWVCVAFMNVPCAERHTCVFSAWCSSATPFIMESNPCNFVSFFHCLHSRLWSSPGNSNNTKKITSKRKKN